MLELACVEERHRTGQAAEAAVAAWLTSQGFTVLARNLRVGRDELDIVARQGALIAVVEVRTRGAGAWTSGFGSIGRQKRLRIRRAGARLWDRELRSDPTIERLRYDAASVTFRDGEPHIEYVPAAF